MSRLQTLLDRLPRLFYTAHEEDSVIYKLMKIVASATDETRKVYDIIQRFWDIDQAYGIGLDRLGKDEGISRGGWDDEEYRKMIKIQCVINLSEGDIPTMNLILDAYMGNDFVGFQDGWADFEPASLLLNISSSATTIPTELIKKIKPAGVRVYVLLNEIVEKIWLLGGTYGWDLNNRICGRFKTAPTHGTLGKEIIISMAEGTYGFNTKSRICGRFRAGGGRK